MTNEALITNLINSGLHTPESAEAAVLMYRDGLLPQHVLEFFRVQSGLRAWMDEAANNDD